LQKIRPADIGDVVVIDVDAGSVTTQYDDLELLPDDVVSCSIV